MGKIDDEIYNNNKKKKINPSILVLGFIFFERFRNVTIFTLLGTRFKRMSRS